MDEMEGIARFVSESMAGDGMDSLVDPGRLDFAEVRSSVTEPERRTPTDSRPEGRSATVPDPAPLPSGF